MRWSEIDCVTVVREREPPRARVFRAHWMIEHPKEEILKALPTSPRV